VKMIDLICTVCGKSFTRQPSRLAHGRGKHCSAACQYAARRAAPKIGVAMVCVGCGVPFTRWPSQLRQKRGCGKYHSRACRDAHRKGAQHPQWIGATTHGPRYYGAHWQAAKRAARQRDGACVRCGATSGLHVHHRIPWRLWEDKDAANELCNLETLCESCHRPVECATKWVSVDGGVIAFRAGGAAAALAAEKGML